MTQKSASTQNSQSQWKNASSMGSIVPFDGINEPGAYIANWSGHLIRVPQDGVVQGRSPLINIVGPESLTVTKISDNPFVPITKARLLASNFDVNVNF